MPLKKIRLAASGTLGIGYRVLEFKRAMSQNIIIGKGASQCHSTRQSRATKQTITRTKWLLHTFR